MSSAQAASPSAAARSFQERVADVRANATSRLDQIPGALVYLRQGSDAETIAIGDAVVEPRRTMAATDTVMVLSLTKTLVATVVLSLVSDGTLSLHDTIGRWLPGVLPSSGDVTIEQLLSMSSGLETYDVAPGYPGAGVLPADELLAMVAGLPRPQLFPAGTSGAESNTNYVALGSIVEKATGEPLAEVLRGE